MHLSKEVFNLMNHQTPIHDLASHSTNELYDSWQVLMKLLKECEEYEVDKSRPCVEEHIPSGEWKKQGYNFYLNALEPVRKIRL